MLLVVVVVVVVVAEVVVVADVVVVDNRNRRGKAWKEKTEIIAVQTLATFLAAAKDASVRPSVMTNLNSVIYLPGSK